MARGHGSDHSYLVLNRVEVLSHFGCDCCDAIFAASADGERALVADAGSERVFFFCSSCGDNIMKRVVSDEARPHYTWDWAIPLSTLEHPTSGVAHKSPRTGYPTMQELEDDGLVETDLQDGRRVYRITELGRKLMEQSDNGIREIWGQQTRWQDLRSEFGPNATMIRGPAERLVKSALSAVAGQFDPTRIERVRTILEQALRDLQPEVNRES